MRKSFEGLNMSYIKKDNYPGLPAELSEFNYYYAESGHILMAVPECNLEKVKDGDYYRYEVPMPVKYVLSKGYRFQDGYLIVEATKGKHILNIDDSYYEYDDDESSPSDNIANAVFYTVGSKMPGFSPRGEGTLFGLGHSELNTIVSIIRPDSSDIINVGEGQYQARLLEFKGIFFVLQKFGNLPWHDSPYTPNIGANAIDFFKKEVPIGGYPLTIYLVDESNGILKAMRTISLSPSFSQQLRKMVLPLENSKFDRNKYRMDLQTIYANYPTTQLVKLSNIYFKQ